LATCCASISRARGRIFAPSLRPVYRRRLLMKTLFSLLLTALSLTAYAQTTSLQTSPPLEEAHPASVGMNDWKVTTAFYSGLHIVNSCLFPLSHNGKRIQRFEQYVDLLRGGGTPHNLRLELCSRLRPDLYHAFRLLYADCHNARYKSYNVSDYTTSRSLKLLTKIMIAGRERCSGCGLEEALENVSEQLLAVSKVLGS